MPGWLNSLPQNEKEDRASLLVVVQSTVFFQFKAASIWAECPKRPQKAAGPGFSLRPWDLSFDSDGLQRNSVPGGCSGPCNHMLYLSKDLGKTFSLVPARPDCRPDEDGVGRRQMSLHGALGLVEIPGNSERFKISLVGQCK